jgi:hypothetical protein
MPARPNDPATPQPGDPTDPSADDQCTGDPTDHHGHAPDPSTGDETVDVGDVGARFTEIVTHLRGAPDPRAWAPDPDVEAEDEHFEPPEPGPVLGPNPLVTMAWCAVIGLPILMVVAVTAWRDIPTIVLEVAGAAFLAGLGLLIWRMPRDRSDDSGPGAVV